MNSRPDRGFDVTRQSPEVAPHFSHALFNNALDRSPPTGVEDSYRSALNIHQHDRQTIRSPDTQQHPRSLRQQTIACELFVRRLTHAMNQIRVDLPQRDQRPRLPTLHESKLAEKSSAVALYRIARILFSKSQVERSSTVNS